MVVNTSKSKNLQKNKYLILSGCEDKNSPLAGLNFNKYLVTVITTSSRKRLIQQKLLCVFGLRTTDVCMLFLLI